MLLWRFMILRTFDFGNGWMFTVFSLFLFEVIFLVAQLPRVMQWFSFYFFFGGGVVRRGSTYLPIVR